MSPVFYTLKPLPHSGLHLSHADRYYSTCWPGMKRS